MGSEDLPANTSTQRGGPVNHGLRLPNIRVGPLVQWCRARPLSFFFLSLANLTLGRLGLSSNLARTATAISWPMIFSHKLIPPLTSSKACPKAISRPCFFLTMPQAIKNEPRMQYRCGKWGKVGPFQAFPHYTLFFSHYHSLSTEEGLDTSCRGAAHATWSAAKWRLPVILLSG
jgi:hypothetical protein